MKETVQDSPESVSSSNDFEDETPAFITKRLNKDKDQNTDN
jgi:hypothetical protein